MGEFIQSTMGQPTGKYTETKNARTNPELC